MKTLEDLVLEKQRRMATSFETTLQKLQSELTEGERYIFASEFKQHDAILPLPFCLLCFWAHSAHICFIWGKSEKLACV